MASQSTLKFSKSDFEQLSIPDLVHNIFSYKNSENWKLRVYLIWCIECLKDGFQAWHDEFRPFDVFLSELLTGVHDEFLDELCHETLSKIYSLLLK